VLGPRSYHRAVLAAAVPVSRSLLPLGLFVLIAAGIGAQDQRKTSAPPPDWGHSAHGVAFDEGPRQRPWRMTGIGSSHFEITTSVPEVQEWFDQGNTLLHSFWYYEAERAFRWCIKLDPRCAIAYWGLARACVRNRERYDAFLHEAVLRKQDASPRERAYIDAWAKASVPDLAVGADAPRLGWNGISPALASAVQDIVLAYPDDIEAKALLVLTGMFERNRYGNELILREVLAAQPDHPGAHHYRIHNWDTLELGVQALPSAARYGVVAPAIGHANHMPGHTYGKLGMWHEAAIWLDSATRVEKEYMRTRLLLPFHDWNYAHNRNYLSACQAQLGMAEAALAGAHDLLNAPLDPRYNVADQGGPGAFRQGIATLRRTLVQFERWQEILDGAIPWREALIDDRVWKLYTRALAHLGTGGLDEAEADVVELRRLEPQAKDALGRVFAIQWREAQGLLFVARGELLDGVALLQDAAQRELDLRRDDNDPPTYPRSVYDVLGEVHLQHGSPGAARACFERSLTVLRNGGVALSGLVRAAMALGERGAAERAYARLRHVWSACDPGLRWLEAARGFGLEVEPRDESPAPQRSYADATLAHLGPERWVPFPAPELRVRDSSGSEVTLAEYRGHDVVLVFYLSDQCVHCLEQLQRLAAKAGEFDRRGAVLLAVSGDAPEKNAGSEQLAGLPLRLLSDQGHDNARRFQAYDDFEDLELHATILIDGEGCVRWARVGGEPFTDVDFLLRELDRDRTLPHATAGTAGGGR